MAIYLGGQKSKFIIDDVVYNINIPSTILITNGVRLLSSDDFTLRDINGLYLTATEYIQSLSADGSILTDIEDKYITIKKG